MKTLIQSLVIAIAFGLITFSAAFAATNRPARPTVAAAYKTSIYSNAEGKLTISLDKEIGGSVVVRLTNSVGKVFFTEQIGKRQTVARLRLDVSELPDGAYQLVISNGTETTTHALMLATQQAAVTSRQIALN